VNGLMRFAGAKRMRVVVNKSSHEQAETACINGCF
jgi:hypothetical protein